MIYNNRKRSDTSIFILKSVLHLHFIWQIFILNSEKLHTVRSRMDRSFMLIKFLIKTAYRESQLLINY